MARTKSSKPKSPSPDTTAIILAKQERLDALQKEHQWLLKQIKRKRTELKNLLEQMRSLATEIFGQAAPSFQKLIALDREIHALFAEIFRTRKFGKQTLPKIEGVYRSLQMMGIISPSEAEDAEAEATDDVNDFEEQQDERNSFNLPGLEFPPRPSRNVRQTFLRLAEIFHPDKVTDGETAMRHTEIMKEINRAYNEGDFARLLEIERQHQTEASVALDHSSDDLERLCSQLSQNNQLLKDQYEELKRELRLVRDTPEGAMVVDYRACVREGINPVEAMLSQAKAEVKATEEIRNFVKDFRDQKMTIKKFLAEPTSQDEVSLEQAEALLEEMFGVQISLQRR